MIAKYLKPLTKNELVTTNTQQFPSLLNNVPLSDGEEDLSYDVESLFTNIPIKETIDYICDEIYNRKKLKPICKQSSFKKLLHKLTITYKLKLTTCTFSVTAKLRKQIVLLWHGWYSVSDSIGLFYEQNGKRCRYSPQTEVLLSICRRHL